MAFLCQYILNINCLWKFLSKIVLFVAYLGFLLSWTVSIPIINSQTKFATLTPWWVGDITDFQIPSLYCCAFASLIQYLKLKYFTCKLPFNLPSTIRSSAMETVLSLQNLDFQFSRIPVPRIQVFTFSFIGSFRIPFVNSSKRFKN